MTEQEMAQDFKAAKVIVKDAAMDVVRTVDHSNCDGVVQVHLLNMEVLMTLINMSEVIQTLFLRRKTMLAIKNDLTSDDLKELTIINKFLYRNDDKGSSSS